MRHPIERAEHELKLGLLKAVLFIGRGVLFFCWPLALGMRQDAAGNEHVAGWTWLIEVPWLVVALAILVVYARNRRR